MADAIAMLEDVRARLAGRGGFERGPRPDDLTVRLRRADDLPAAARRARRRRPGAGDAGGDRRRGDRRTATSRSATSSSRRSADARPLPDLFVTLLVSLDPARPELPSISAEVPAANWHEREARDLFGIAFAGHPDPRPLVVHDGWPEGLYPLRKRFDAQQRPPVEPAEEFPHLVVEGEGVFEVPVGPIHAGIIEPGHFRFSTVGESVLQPRAAPVLHAPRAGEAHRGARRCDDAFYVAERMCGVCSVVARARVLRGGRADRRRSRCRAARASLRTVALELERLYNHVGDIGNIARRSELPLRHLRRARA